MVGGNWISNIRKLSAIYAGLLVLAVLTLAGFVFTAYEVASFSESKAVTEADVEGLEDIFAYGGGTALRKALAKRVNEGQDAAFYLLLDDAGTMLAGNFTSLPQAPTEIIPPHKIYEIPYEAVTDGAPQRREVLSDHFDVLAQTRTLENGWVLFVGRDIEVFQTGRQVIEALSWIVFILLALFAFVGFSVASLILRRLNTMTSTAEEIMETGDLSTRIDIGNMSGEFRDLGGALNGMLAKIQALVIGVRQVSDDIAHDLRTPLTRLQHHLEEVSRRSPEAGVDKAIDETARIVSTFNALLRIARIENNGTKQSFEPVDLRELLRDVQEYYLPFFEESGGALILEAGPDPMTVHGDRHMLFQAFANLIENAIRYSPQGGEILLALRPADPGGVEVLVRDAGPGIPEADKARVFDRFYRTEASRSSPGSGLGLAMVQAVAGLHGAEVWLADAEPQGLEVHLLFGNLTNP